MREKVHDGQASEKGSSPMMLMSSLTMWFLCGTNLLCNTGKPQSINQFLVIYKS
jgi:hypothetical protein